ncbi:MAG: histidine triad nucleotide-binding protein [Campylobacterales bacterium]|nr:histidine triad nucleotide-binding protein [Campylobacterales bacterium]
MSTIFKKIIDGEIPCNKVYEDEKTLAFHDIDPQAPIHILVIPKVEVPNIYESNGEIVADCLNAIQKVTEKLGLNKSGFRIITNNGVDAGQEVEHLHFHILGGTKLGHIHHKDTTKDNI